MPGSFAMPALACGAALMMYPAATHVMEHDKAVPTRDETDLSPVFIELDPNDHQITISEDGLYYADGRATNKAVRFVVDSGANTTILTQQDARRLGIDVDRLHYRQRLVTANGYAPLAFTQLPSLTVGGRTFTDVQVAIFGRGGGTSLLGQDMLRRFRRFAIEDGVMTLA